MTSHWLMNLPADPADPEAWEAWVKTRHPEASEDEITAHLQEWSRFLANKIINQRPKAARKSAEEYKKMGWMGVYSQ